MATAADISGALREVGALLEFSRQPKFRVKAYERAANVVTAVADLGALVAEDRLTDIEGIGPALARQITELWSTGRSEYLDRLRAELPEGASELVQVQGVTPKRLRVLHEALGVRSVRDLSEACRAERVRALPGFGPKTERALLAACDAWLNRQEQAAQPVILSRALERAERLRSELEQAGIAATLSGALRRGEESVREIELVAQADERIFSRLSELRQVLRVDAQARFAQLSDGLGLRVHLATPENFGSALVLSTGSDAHVALLEQRARERGFRLNREEPTLRREFASEQRLYDALGLSWIPPEVRSGTQEVDVAASSSFDDLIDISQVQGLVHCHTSYSDGRGSVLDMARAAHARGMKYITITDHSPSAHYARGASLEALERQWDEIALAETQVPIRILRGIECDILADGSLDLPDSYVKRLDVVIASIHARYRMDRVAMTKRIERALALPVFKIWGHPLGRILNHREAVDCDVPLLLDVLAGSRGALEINADPHRLDLPAAWIPAARERNIPFVLAVDAHSKDGFDVLRYGATIARHGGVRRNEVLNTRSASEFAAAVKPV